MTLTWLSEHSPFPLTKQAMGVDSDAPGLLAAGGDLSVERLRDAYRRGIFPWYAEGQPVLWWSPDPRMVLPVDSFRVSRSFRKTLQKFIAGGNCEVRIDTSFREVISACANSPREGQAGTWIVPEMIEAYVHLHQVGQAHCVETWIDNELVGGLYGVNIGLMFYGESMFARCTDASKIALAALVALCRGNGISLIDCQQHTRHLASLGARQIPRSEFEEHLASVVDCPAPRAWSYDRSHWQLLALTSVAPSPIHAPPLP